MYSTSVFTAGWKLVLCAMAGCALLAGQTVVVRVTPRRPVGTRIVAVPMARPVWVPGYRVVPPSPRAVWVAPAWGYAPVRRPRVVISGSW